MFIVLGGVVTQNGSESLEDKSISIFLRKNYYKSGQNKKRVREGELKVWSLYRVKGQEVWFLVPLQK